MAWCGAAVERQLQRAFGALGALVASRPLLVSLSCLGVLAALGAGGFGGGVSTETDVFELWVEQGTRLMNEMDFYEEEWSGSRVQSLIATCNDEAGEPCALLSVEALGELANLTDWLLRLEYTPPTLKSGKTYPPFTFESICYKVVDTQPEHPCFVNTILDCFQEGNVGVLGGANNSEVWKIYQERTSFLDPDFDLSVDFNDLYKDDKCMYWFQLGYPWRMFSGGVDWYLPGHELYDPNLAGGRVLDWDWEKQGAQMDPLTQEPINPAMHSVDALRVVMSAYDEVAIVEKGLRFVEWNPTPTCVEEDILECPAPECSALRQVQEAQERGEGAPAEVVALSAGCDCFECVLNDAALHPVLVGALGATCIPDANLEAQSDMCCQFMADTGKHPCAPHLYKFSTSVLTYGAFVNRQCGLPVPNLGGRCETDSLAAPPSRRLLADLSDVDEDVALSAREALRAVITGVDANAAAAAVAAMADAGMTLREAMGVALGDESNEAFWREAREEVERQGLTAQPDGTSDSHFWERYQAEVRGAAQAARGANSAGSAAAAAGTAARRHPGSFVETLRRHLSERNSTGVPIYGNRTSAVAAIVSEVRVKLARAVLSSPNTLQQLVEKVALVYRKNIALPGEAITAEGNVQVRSELRLRGLSAGSLNLQTLANRYARAAGLSGLDVSAELVNDGAGRRRLIAEAGDGVVVAITVELPDSESQVAAQLAVAEDVETLATEAASAFGDSVSVDIIGEPDVGINIEVVVATSVEEDVAIIQDVQLQALEAAVEEAVIDEGFTAPIVEYDIELPAGVVPNIEPAECGYKADEDASWALPPGGCSGDPSRKSGCGTNCPYNYNGYCEDTQTFQTPNGIKLEVETEEDALELIQGWERFWSEKIVDKIKQYRHIKPSWLSGSSVDDTIKDATVAQIPLLVVGYVLVYIFSVGLYMIEINPVHGLRLSKVGPTWWVIAVAVLAIAFSVFGALGIAALISNGSAIKYNALTLQVVPFLGIGLGINDFYIAAASFHRAAITLKPHPSPAQICAEGMRVGGASITLSSATNMFAFFLGALAPIPAVSAYAIQVALVIFTNWLVAITIFPAVLYAGLRGKDAAIEELAKTHRRGAKSLKEKATSSDGLDASDAEIAPSLLESLLRNNLLKAGIVLIYLALLTVCIGGIFAVEKGLSLSDAVPNDQDLHEYAVNSEKYFTSSTVWLTVRDLNGNEAEAVNLRELDYAFVNEAAYMDTDYECTNFLRYFTDYVEGKMENDEICHDEVYYYYDTWLEQRNACGGRTFPSAMTRRGGDGPETVATCRDFCEGGFARKSLSVDPAHACVYSEPSDHQGNAVPTCTCPYRPLPLTGTWYIPVGGRTESFVDHFMHTDIKGRISRAITKTQYEGINRTTFGAVTNYRILTFVNDLDSVAKRVEHIRSARSVADAQDINRPGLTDHDTKNAYPFDWILYGLNEQYLHSDDNALFAISISVVAGFVVMLPLIVHPAAAIIVTALLIAVEVELYGLLPYFGMKLNSVTIVNLISAIGIAVEFHTHLARAFMLAKGDRVTRVVAALREVGSPIVCGDFLAVVAIAFSYYDYFVLYFFIQFTIIILVCAVNALVLLPVLLTWVGPPAFAGEQEPDCDDPNENLPVEK